jgi:hypothetical protein
MFRVALVRNAEGVHGGDGDHHVQIPNYQVLVAKVYTTTTSYVGGFSTEDNGDTGIMLGITSAPVRSPAAIAVAIGPAF